MVKDFKVEGTGPEAKSHELTEHDPVWAKHRHSNVADVWKTVAAEEQDLRAKISKIEGGGLSEMKDIVRSLPEFMEKKKFLGIHLQLLAQCIEVFNKRQMDSVTDVEQRMVAGMDREGDVLRKVLKDILIERSAKFRLIVLALVYGWVETSADSCEQLLRFAELPTTVKDRLIALANLIKKAQTSEARKRPSGMNLLQAKKVESFEPLLRGVLQRVLTDATMGALFPLAHAVTQKAEVSTAAKAIASPPSGNSRGVLPTWHVVRTQHKVESPKRMYIVFVGGVTMTDVRVAYEEAARVGFDIVIVSNCILTPSHFAEELIARKTVSDGSPDLSTTGIRKPAV